MSTQHNSTLTAMPPVALSRFAIEQGRADKSLRGQPRWKAYADFKRTIENRLPVNAPYFWRDALIDAYTGEAGL